MIWLSWRQMRAQAAVVGGALVAVLLALSVTRPHLVEVFGPRGSGQLTGPVVSLRLLGTALIGLPAAFGAFWGAPMIAGELEAGTHRLAWSQSITRQRWFLTKFTVAAVVTVVVVAIFTMAFTWWCGPIDSAGASRIGTANFAQRGVAPIGYALFALALGALAGVVMRRILPAMAATLVGFFVVRLVVQKLVRQHLVSATTVLTDPFGAGPRGGWTLSARTVDRAGQPMSGQDLEGRLVAACRITRATPDVDGALASCAHQMSIRNLTRTIPSSSFWQLQAAELALFVGLAIVATGVTVWWLRHRIA